MRVRLTCDRSGYFGLQQAGEEFDLPRDEAMRLMAAGQAEAVEHESAARPAAENADKRPMRRTK